MLALQKPFQKFSLSTVGQSGKLERETIKIAKGKVMGELRARFAVPLANTSGGNIVLSDAQKLSWLGGWEATLNWGPSQRFKPYNSTPLDKVREISRETLLRDITGFSNSSTGLARTLTNGATTTVTYTVPLPTGKDKKIRTWGRGRGMGRSQLMTSFFEMKWKSTTLPSGLAVNGNITIEIYLVLESAKGDQVLVVPSYFETEPTGKRFSLEDGLPRLVFLRNSTHAATAVTEFSTWVDAEPVAEQTVPSDWKEAYEEQELLTSAMNITDRYLLVHTQELYTLPEDVLTGRFTFEQPKGELSSMQAAGLHYPILTTGDWDAVAEEISRMRGKPVRLTSNYVLEGQHMKLPDRLQPYFPATAFDADDREFHQYGHRWAEKGKRTTVSLPKSKVDLLKSQVDAASADHEKLGNLMLRQAVAAIPGGIQDGRGGDRKSEVAIQLEQLIRS